MKNWVLPTYMHFATLPKFTTFTFIIHKSYFPLSSEQIFLPLVPLPAINRSYVLLLMIPLTVPARIVGQARSDWAVGLFRVGLLVTTDFVLWPGLPIKIIYIGFSEGKIIVNRVSPIHFSMIFS